jgi:hypothetical protein
VRELVAHRTRRARAPSALRIRMVFFVDGGEGTAKEVVEQRLDAGLCFFARACSPGR